MDRALEQKLHVKGHGEARPTQTERGGRSTLLPSARPIAALLASQQGGDRSITYLTAGALPTRGRFRYKCRLSRLGVAGKETGIGRACPPSYLRNKPRGTDA
jgi:hypothetical protein